MHVHPHCLVVPNALVSVLDAGRVQLTVLASSGNDISPTLAPLASTSRHKKNVLATKNLAGHAGPPTEMGSTPRPSIGIAAGMRG